MENAATTTVMDKDPRRKKVSLNHQPDLSSLLEGKPEPKIYDKDVGSPLVRLMYDFFTDPHSSNAAYIWGQLTAWIAITRVLEIAFESCDGPNQYVGRAVDNSRYYFFLTDSQYWKVYIACMVPLIIDAVGRMVMLGFVIFASENNALYHTLRQDGLEMFLLFADIVGVIPFMVTAIYLRPYSIPANQLQNVVTTLLELLITARILRLIKNMPPIRSIRIALLNSVDHLVLPVFFFLTFNITSGVFLYFVEPCYNVDICPWQDLFESSFFSIVTMTTSKCCDLMFLFLCYFVTLCTLAVCNVIFRQVNYASKFVIPLMSIKRSRLWKPDSLLRTGEIRRLLRNGVRSALFVHASRHYRYVSTCTF